MWEFINPSSQAFSMISCGHVPSLSYSQATGRISPAAKSCAISRRAFCSSVSVKSTILGSPIGLPQDRRLTGQSISHGQGSGVLVDEQQSVAVQSLFPIIVFGAVAFSIVMSVVFLVSRSGMYDHIGQGGLSRDSDHVGAGAPPAPESPA